MLDAQPQAGDNYYRIRSVDLNGTGRYSQVVKVRMGAGNPSIAVYPNPVTNRVISLQFSNMEKGIYGLRLLNAAGQVLMSSKISHAGGSATETITLGKNIANGSYHLEIIHPDKTRTEQAVIVAN